MEKMYCPNLKFREIKLKLNNGSWKTLPKIHTIPKLESTLKKQDYSRAYYSVQKYRHPKERTGFMGSNLVFDLDFKDYPMALKIIDFIKKKYPKLNLLYTAETPRGLHIVYDDELINNPFKRKPKKPKNWKGWYERCRKELVKEMKNEGLVFDFDITVKEGVIGLPDSNKYKLISHEMMQERSQKAMIWGDFSQTPPSYTKKEVVEVPAHSSYNYLFVSNKVKEDKYVLYFKYPNLAKAVLDLENLNYRFQIYPIYLFEDNKGVYCMGVKLFSKDRWKKILKQSLASNKDNVKKYSQSLIKISKDFKKGKPLKRLDFLTQLGEVNDYSHYSAFHSRYLSEVYGIDTRKEFQVGDKVGGGMIKIR